MESKYIDMDKDIMGGRPVFKGTRILVESLFWHLEAGTGINDFLEEFPSVQKEQIQGILQTVTKLFNTTPIFTVYENVA